MQPRYRRLERNPTYLPKLALAELLLEAEPRPREIHSGGPIPSRPWGQRGHSIGVAPERLPKKVTFFCYFVCSSFRIISDSHLFSFFLYRDLI